jgi:protein archease
VRAERAAPVACEWLDHTGDVGMVVRGESPAELFAVAGAALAELMVDPAGVSEAGSRQVRVEAARLDELMVRFLNALIYMRETEDFVWKRIVVDLEEPPRLSAGAFGEPFRADRHESRGGVKAATYHELAMGEDREGWWARIVLDV